MYIASRPRRGRREPARPAEFGETGASHDAATHRDSAIRPRGGGRYRGGAGVTATALSQQVYYGDLTYAENLEVRQWSEHYWSRVEAPTTSPGTGFAFTSPLLNSHLFNPVRSGRPALEALDLISTEACDGAYNPE